MPPALAQALIAFLTAVATMTGSVTAHALSPARTSACTTANSRMNIVAHQDDDLLFINPATDTDVAAGRCLTTVYLTAGDAGNDSSSYWQGREAGAMAAYAQMAGVPDSWHTSTLLTASGRRVTTVTLAGRHIRLIFLRLPSGSPHGYAIHDFECLSRLRDGSITTVQAVDGSAAYTGASLRSTLTGFMTVYHPSVVRTLDYTGSYRDGDHADHHNTAYYAYEAQQKYRTPHTLLGFRGYPITALPANQPSSVADRKLSIFLAYAAHDPLMCRTTTTCHAKKRYWSWFARSYQVSGPPNLDGH
jgi:LmbE family N-acetylglucosaminyl deacetylase